MSNLSNASILSPEAATILATIAMDLTITQVGPYNTGDTGTGTVEVHRICPSPLTLGELFLHHETVTLKVYFGIFYPVIATEEKQAECTPLTNLFCALSVGDLSTLAVNTNRPAPSPQSDTLAREYDKVGKRLFPALCTDGSIAQQRNIATRSAVE